MLSISRPNVTGLPGRMTPESAPECAWNRWPNHAGICSDLFPLIPKRSSTDTIATSCSISGSTVQFFTLRVTSRLFRTKSPLTSMARTLAVPLAKEPLYWKSSRVLILDGDCCGGSNDDQNGSYNLHRYQNFTQYQISQNQREGNFDNADQRANRGAEFLHSF